jgi:hypothetical protein
MPLFRLALERAYYRQGFSNVRLTSIDSSRQGSTTR